MTQPGPVLSRPVRAAWIAAVMALVATPSHAATVEQFSPQGLVKDVRQVTARFSTAMVALGDPRLPEPFIVDCGAKGHGRWADTRNWVYDFDEDLPAGLVCRFSLQDGLKSHGGEAITGSRVFTFNTGGPSIRASMPDEGSTIDAEQVFVLALDAPAAVESVQQHAACAVDNIAERIPVEVLTDAERTRLLEQRTALGWQYARLFDALSDESVDRMTRADVERIEAAMTVLRCRRALPAGGRVTLLWGAGIRTTGGLETTTEQALAFAVRPDFTVRMECDRVNADAPCLPMMPVRVVFSSQVPVAQARKVTLKDASGRAYTALGLEELESSMTDGLNFGGPFPERGKLVLDLGDGLVDDVGRRPANAERYPLEIPLDEYPPLIKFSGQFGILEAAAGGVLPVTVRNVEKPVTGRRAGMAPNRGIAGESMRIDRDADIADWIRRVEKASESRGEWEQPEKDEPGQWHELTGSTSVFADGDVTEPFTVPRVTSEREFEVVGIPLGKPGFYVVELASPRLGAALLGAPRPRYVATAALVTNLSVHLKWGRESSRVWITALDTGRPVRGAAIRISGWCSGNERWSGVTDGDGIARIDETLGEPHSNSGCNEWSPEPLMVSARIDGDMSFALSGWQRGIEPSDFRVPTGWGGEEDTYVASTVFDRTLLRAGETVSMKHFLRQHVSSGLKVPTQTTWPTELVLSHEGSGQRYTLPVKFDASGIAESSWPIPADAKLGTYRVSLGGGADKRAYASGEFRVEQYRVPTMKAVVQAPAAPVVDARSVSLDLFVGYLSGGAAAGAPVRLRTLVEPRTPWFRDYADYEFGGADVKEGIEEPEGEDLLTWLHGLRFGEYAARAGERTEAAAVQSLVLDEHGAARVSVPLPKIDTNKSLLAEMEYEDANGELLTAATRVPLWPASLSLGLRVEGWVATRDELKFKVVAVDAGGKPVSGRRVEVDLFERRNLSYRKRLIGGFYAYESKVEVRRLPATCSGRTDARGLLDCNVEPGVSGEVVLRAQAADDSDHIALASTTAWVAGGEDWWFVPGSADRMDVLPEQKEYQPGDEARLQVRMPFRSATALVTIEREGVIDSFVTRLSGREPVVEIPIKGNYAPNIYVSVLAVRGRVSGWRAWLADLTRKYKLPLHFDGGSETALVDLNKPAFKLGLAEIRVGWSAQRLAVAVEPQREVYRVRERAVVDVRVRRENGDALPAGSEVALAAVDEGLLELRPNDSWALLDHMMDERPIEVWTATAQMQVVGKRHYGRKAIAQGGGGGRAGARELFDTLLLWKGRVKLDANGHARIQVPLNDSLTSFRIVAIASAGTQYFGTGSADIRTTQDLMLHSGLPPLVREGDKYAATFTVRNASKQPMRVKAAATVQPGGALPAQTLDLPAGGARDVVWQAAAPVDAAKLRWDVSVASLDGQASDRMIANQSVIAAYPVRVYQATLLQLDGSASMPVERPRGAIPRRGGVALSVQPTLAAGLAGVREYMSLYPYSCLEQRVSRAIALRDEKRWNGVMADLPSYLDPDGLLRYFPTDRLQGSDTLTAYVLSIAQEAGYEIPGDVRARLLDALKRFTAGRLVRDSVLPTADLTLRKLAAIEALARYQSADPAIVSSLAIEPSLWPTSGVIAWINVLDRVEGIARRAERRAAAGQVLRSRLNFQGTQMGFSTERTDALWWLMISPDTNAVRALLSVLDDDGWREDAPRMLRGALGRQRDGRWNTTTANAWGTLAIEKFSAAYEKAPVSGRSSFSIGDARRSITWPARDVPVELEFPWADAPRTLTMAHEGSGRPWIVVQSRAALPLEAPFNSGFAIERKVTPVEQKTAGRWTRGDVARVSLSIDAQSDMGWVVVEDPVPSGASILGQGLGRDSVTLRQGEQREGDVLAAFEERRFDFFRAYYSYVPKGRFTVEYTLRYNNPGTFHLPATRVEALYAPEMLGERPNADLEVVAAK